MSQEFYERLQNIQNQSSVSNDSSINEKINFLSGGNSGAGINASPDINTAGLINQIKSKQPSFFEDAKSDISEGASGAIKNGLIDPFKKAGAKIRKDVEDKKLTPISSTAIPVAVAEGVVNIALEGIKTVGKIVLTDEQEEAIAGKFEEFGESVAKVDIVKSAINEWNKLPDDVKSSLEGASFIGDALTGGIASKIAKEPIKQAAASVSVPDIKAPNIKLPKGNKGELSDSNDIFEKITSDITAGTSRESAKKVDTGRKGISAALLGENKRVIPSGEKDLSRIETARKHLSLKSDDNKFDVIQKADSARTVIHNELTPIGKAAKQSFDENAIVSIKSRANKLAETTLERSDLVGDAKKMVERQKESFDKFLDGLSKVTDVEGIRAMRIAYDKSPSVKGVKDVLKVNGDAGREAVRELWLDNRAILNGVYHEAFERIVKDASSKQKLKEMRDLFAIENDVLRTIKASDLKNKDGLLTKKGATRAALRSVLSILGLKAAF